GLVRVGLGDLGVPGGLAVRDGLVRGRGAGGREGRTGGAGPTRRTGRRTGRFGLRGQPGVRCGGVQGLRGGGRGVVGVRAGGVLGHAVLPGGVTVGLLAGVTVGAVLAAAVVVLAVIILAEVVLAVAVGAVPGVGAVRQGGPGLSPALGLGLGLGGLGRRRA